MSRGGPDKFFVLRGDATGERWKQTAVCIVEVGRGAKPLVVYRLRRCARFPLVRYFAEAELKRLFVGLS